MSTVGKVCLVITLLLLLVAFLPIPGPYGGWTPKLLVIHSQWSEKFRDARQKTLDAQRSHDLARQELSKATADVDSLTIGWAQFWNIPARGPNNPPNAPQINIDNNGRLQTTNLGSDHGLKQRSFEDAQGASKTMSPTVHAFVAGAEGYVYAGEYIATQTTPNSAVLTPVQNLRDRAAFLRQNIGGNWRLRTLIPTAKRMTNDELHQHFRRTAEMTQRTTANIERQQRLFKEAEVAYQTRRGELLGDDTREPVAERPEFTKGLLLVIEETEEQRNQLQLDVDDLRRRIKAAIEDQSRYIESLNENAANLPGSAAAYEKITGNPAQAK